MLEIPSIGTINRHLAPLPAGHVYDPVGEMWRQVERVREQAMEL